MPRESPGGDKDIRQMALRLTCSERPPGKTKVTMETKITNVFN